MTYIDLDKTDTKISGIYYGNRYNGIIERTTVMGDGNVQYHVRLQNMINVGTEKNHDYRSLILIDHEKDYGKYVLGEAI